MLWNGLNLEQWFERFLRNLGDVPSAVLSEGVEPMGIVEGPYDGKPNPHAWMSPEVGSIYVENIRKALTEIDPANAEVYAANAAAYTTEIRAVAEPIRAELAAIPEDRRWLVTSEGAFSYLARDFGLRELYIWPINADQQGSPQQVRKVIDAMREHEVPAIFSESTVPADAAEQVARETGARLRRRALRRQPVGAGRAGADLSRHAAGHRRDHRRGAGAMNAPEPLRAAEPAPRATGLRLGDVSVTYRTGLTAIERGELRDPARHDHRARRGQRLGQVDAVQGDHGLRARSRRGSVEILGRPARAALADNLVAYVPQAEEVDWTFPVLVEDVVMMGRYGHMGWLRRPSAHDRALVDAALGARRHGRLPPPADRRALGRPEEAGVPRPRPGAGGPGHPARRALHRRRRHHRGGDRPAPTASCATRAG